MTSQAMRRARLIGVALLLLGAALLVAAFSVVRIDPNAWRASPAVVAVMGVMVAVCSVLAGRWVRLDSAFYDVLGASVFTALAFLCACVALCGSAAGFRGSVGGAGVPLTASSSVGSARNVFGRGGLALCAMPLGSGGAPFAGTTE